ncbi:MBL fold metallo-hydrolase [Yoonia sp. GPGPB17]|uniref:MBL fold metallo-hydrolase n=1 Tax=Yoonia sp. GPGPB17 TaxID=3026147 RepID=UPI0030C135F5
MIRPIFTNTASFTTRAGLILRGGKGKLTLPVRCGLIVHPTLGPVLIDAGCGPRLTDDPKRSFGLRLYNRMLGPVIHHHTSPMALLAAHGFAPTDVVRIFVTHLHADHIAYLEAFPNARFVTDNVGTGGIRHGVFPELLPDDFATRQEMLRDSPKGALPFALGDGFDLFDDGTVLGVPLPGHARGHYGLCFTGAQPLLYAVDAQWLMPGIMEDRIPGFPANLLAHDPAALRDSVALVRRFALAGGMVVLCHDPTPNPYDWSPGDV